MFHVGKVLMRFLPHCQLVVTIEIVLRTYFDEGVKTQSMYMKM